MSESANGIFQPLIFGLVQNRWKKGENFSDGRNHGIIVMERKGRGKVMDFL